MKLTINIPKEEEADFLNMLDEIHRYSPTVPGTGANEVKNPESREDYLKRMFVKSVADGFVNWRKRKVIIKTGIE